MWISRRRDGSPVKVSLLIFFYAHCFPLSLHWDFHIIISYFLVKDRNSFVFSIQIGE
jgi:hypothetical protein